MTEIVKELTDEEVKELSAKAFDEVVEIFKKLPVKARYALKDRLNIAQKIDPAELQVKKWGLVCIECGELSLRFRGEDRPMGGPDDEEWYQDKPRVKMGRPMCQNCGSSIPIINNAFLDLQAFERPDKCRIVEVDVWRKKKDESLRQNQIIFNEVLGRGEPGGEYVQAGSSLPDPQREITEGEVHGSIAKTHADHGSPMTHAKIQKLADLAGLDQINVRGSSIHRHFKETKK